MTDYALLQRASDAYGRVEIALAGVNRAGFIAAVRNLPDSDFEPGEVEYYALGAVCNAAYHLGWTIDRDFVRYLRADV